ncbi:proprotein convertase subtilisin/kexin type 6-like isoform X2 [Lithobates pipiens]
MAAFECHSLSLPLLKYICLFHSLSGSVCTPECEQGTFYNVVFMKCEKCHSTCHSCVGTGKDQCTQCSKDYHLHDWRCLPMCGLGFYSEDIPGLPHKVCRRCEENCLMCEATGKNCVRCKEGYSLLSGSCVTNHTCNNDLLRMKGIIPRN